MVVTSWLILQVLALASVGLHLWLWYRRRQTEKKVTYLRRFSSYAPQYEFLMGFRRQRAVCGACGHPFDENEFFLEYAVCSTCNVACHEACLRGSYYDEYECVDCRYGGD